MTSLKCPCCYNKLLIENKLYLLDDKDDFLLSILIRPTSDNTTNQGLRSEAFDTVKIPRRK